MDVTSAWKWSCQIRQLAWLQGYIYDANMDAIDGTLERRKRRMGCIIHRLNDVFKDPAPHYRRNEPFDMHREEGLMLQNKGL